MSPTDDRSQCPMCERKVKSGVLCQATYCPYEHAVNRQGRIVLARPLKQRIH